MNNLTLNNSAKKIIKDPLYKQILIDEKHLQYLNSPEFQRLRYIKQTTSADLVYPNANHTRFSHSIGAYHLMKKVISNGHMQLTSKEKNDLQLAALLHDIGHGPFSHLWERVFPHFDHEKATIQILKKFKLNDVASIIDKKSPLSPLITSTLDVDKLDYMARDSYFAGVSYGVMEVDFITQRMYLKDNKLVIRPSSISSVEDLITQRVNLFKTVYFHKAVEMFEHMLYLIFTRVGELLKKKISIEVQKDILAFYQKKNTIENLLNLNDSIVISQIMSWLNHSDEILSMLCKKYINRETIHAINLEHTSKTIKNFEEEFNLNLPPPYKYHISNQKITILQTPVYVEFEDGTLTPLEEVSKIIKFYTTIDFEVKYLFYI
ncbi:MAG: HD domain-containing protein [Nanoarchaeota archaeon]|nr:HD domain-containing protein [Nanoarchaeota archaeon]